MARKSRKIIDVESIASRLLLTTLSTSAWRATKLHKDETAAEQQRHKSDAPKVLVTISKHAALLELYKLHSDAYHTHRALTLPSVQDGMRLVPASGQLKHSDELRKFGEQHKKLVRAFMRDYDDEKAAAPAKLNGLFDARMWPSHEEVEERFGFETRYLSCPVDGQWKDWLNESAQIAEDALRDRLRDALLRVRDRCKGDGKLFSTVFSNIAELCAMVPALNLTAAVDLDAVAASATSLGDLSAEALRDDKEGRKQVAKEASRILSLLGAVK